MRTRTVLAATAAVTAVVLALPAQAGPTVTTFTDPAGDVGVNATAVGPVPAGVDIVKGSIARKGKDLVFTVTMADMPRPARSPRAPGCSTTSTWRTPSGG